MRQTGGTCIGIRNSDSNAPRPPFTCYASVLQALIKPTRSEKHPRVMVSMDWTDLLPRSEIVSPLICCSHAPAANRHQTAKSYPVKLCNSLLPSCSGLGPPLLQVHWEFWSNANDMCGPVCDVQKSFMKARPAAVPCALKQSKPAALLARRCCICDARPKGPARCLPCCCCQPGVWAMQHATHTSRGWNPNPEL